MVHYIEGTKRFSGTDIGADVREKYGYDGDLLKFFLSGNGQQCGKWHHYLPLYDRYLSKFRGKEVRVLEIGFGQGGSMNMWRRYFGSKARLVGIDIEPDAAIWDGVAGRVMIGSQDDTGLLDRALDYLGGLDVVLDDGSHRMADIRASLLHLFPRLSLGGVYLIEDLHTAFLEHFGGGYVEPANIFNFARGIVDDMHGWYHAEQAHEPRVGPLVSGLHVHDSFMVLEKDAVFQPVYSIA